MGDGTLSNIDSVDREEDLKDFPTCPQDSPMTGYLLSDIVSAGSRTGTFESRYPDHP